VKRLWNPFRKKETRETLEEILLKGGLITSDITKEQAMAIPSVSACVDLICNTIASLPILLYKENNGQTEVVEDYRTDLLNDDTLDSLDGFSFKRANIESYLLLGSSYSFINRKLNTVKSLHYINNDFITINLRPDPIFKKYDITINGKGYRDWEFVKLIRKTKDGVTGKGIISENNKMLSLLYNTIIYEENSMKGGANKKGFLKSQNRLSKDAMDELKLAWNNLYKNNNTENCIILNNGLEFQDASNTAMDLQLSQNKLANSDEICKIFLVPPRILSGEASAEEYNHWVKICISPILTAFECALNKDLLLPSEKQSFYFAFDTTELMKASAIDRFKTYEIGLKNGILQIDECRFKENLPSLNLNFVKLGGLADVLFDPVTKTIYTPNTDKSNNMENPTDNTNNENPQAKLRGIASK
jgi:HK97 family phage portal protein